MTESLVIAAILAICAVILWLRPQSISTLSGNPEENPELNWRAVRRIGAGGLLLLAVVIVYNLVTINVAERIRELSTIKVLGFYPREVTMYIYRETIINSCLALPVGWLLGWMLQQYIIAAVPPENVMFDPACGWLPFVVSTVVIVLVVAAMYAVVNRYLRRVDMLEALKSVD